MSEIYKTAEGARLIYERYSKFLAYWPVPCQHLRVATGEGETFVIACGPPDGPPVVLLHGGAMNSAMWLGDVSNWARHFRIYAVDLIGEPGLSAPSRPPLASDAHALWLDDVLAALSVKRTSIVGISLGGWIALDFAIRRPDRVTALALLCPGGVGRQKISIVFMTLALRMCGAWGKRKLKEIILGRSPGNPSRAAQAFGDYIDLIHQHFRPRMVKLPIFADADLRRLKTPLMAIVGAKDVLLDSEGTRRRLSQFATKAEVRYLPEAGHAIAGQTEHIREFLTGHVLIRGES